MSVKSLHGDKLVFHCPNCKNNRELNIKTDGLGYYFDNNGKSYVRLPECECKTVSFLIAGKNKTDSDHIRRIVTKRVIEHGRNENDATDIDMQRCIESMTSVYNNDPDGLKQFETGNCTVDIK